MAARALARSAASSRSVELTKTRNSWSGVRMVRAAGNPLTVHPFASVSTPTAAILARGSRRRPPKRTPQGGGGYCGRVTVRLSAVRFDSPDPARMAAFWAGVLGRVPVEAEGALFLPGDETQIGLRFVEGPIVRTGRNRLHLHLTSEGHGEQLEMLERIASLGGARRGTKPLHAGRDIYAADPDGNEICLIAPGNDYLAGCGLLGEVTCDGRRAAGLFWHEVLGWPLVWDRDEQVVIQSPAGGTKVAWDAWPDSPARGREGQRFEVVASDLAADVLDLVAAGARVVDDLGDTLTLCDPGGDAFSVSHS